MVFGWGKKKTEQETIDPHKEKQIKPSEIKDVLDEKNKDEVSQVVERARKMVEENYNWDKVTAAFKGLL